jgi:hypothetical protein
MTFHYESSKTLNTGLREINVLLRHSRNAIKKKKDSERILFLKLAIVMMVTKFQAYIESIFEEVFTETKRKTYNILPLHLKLQLQEKTKIIP